MASLLWPNRPKCTATVAHAAPEEKQDFCYFSGQYWAICPLITVD